MEPSERVVERIAAAEGRDPSEVEEMLDEAIDIGALDTVLNSLNNSPRKTQAEVQLFFEDYEVSISEDNHITFCRLR